MVKGYQIYRSIYNKYFYHNNICFISIVLRGHHCDCFYCGFNKFSNNFGIIFNQKNGESMKHKGIFSFILCTFSFLMYVYIAVYVGIF